MKFIKYIFLTLLIFSCDDDSDSIDAGTSELQGFWSGSMINMSDPIVTSYEVAGQPLTEYSGLTSLCIYQIEGDTLSFSGAEPGTSERPTNFTGNEGGMQVY